VQIIDTTVTHVHVYDTIVTHVYDTIQPNLITVYEKLITAQDNNFDNILILITVIVTVLIVVFTAYNFFGAKKLFKIEFKKMIEDERENIKKAALENVEKELHLLKGESARLFANSTADDPLEVANYIYWWAKCIKEYTLADNQRMVSYSIELLVYGLKRAIGSKEIFYKNFKDSEYKFEKITERVSYLPDIVSEKKVILEMLDELEEYYNQTEEVVEEAVVVE